MRVCCLGAAVAALAFGLAATQASATVITKTFAFKLSGFPTGAPYDPVKGKATITFDPTVDTVDDTSDITLSIDIPIGTPGGSYITADHEMFIGSENCGGVGSVCYNQDDFLVTIIDAPPFPPGGAAVHDGEYGSSTHATQVWDASDATAAVVPEPAAWGMMILGFGLLGGASRTRRSAATA